MPRQKASELMPLFQSPPSPWHKLVERRLVSRWTPGKGDLKRRSLVDIASSAHCSILGTCLPLEDLRRLVLKIGGVKKEPLSDYQIHTLAVQYASTIGAPSKILNKALDERHAATIRKLQAVGSEAMLRASWSEARREGGIDAMFWAIATHPLAGEHFFGEVFGDVHMLSHIVGAANRANIKQLLHLQNEREQLSRRLTKLQLAAHEGWSRRDREVNLLRGLLANAAGKHQAQRTDSAEPLKLEQALAQAEKRASGLETRNVTLQDK